MPKTLETIEKYLLYAIIFLFPIAALATSPNPFVVPKLTILVFGLGAVLLLKSLRTIIGGKLDFSFGAYDFSVFLIMIAYVASTIFRTSNKMEALLVPGTATIVASGAILYFLINQLENKEKETASVILILSGVFSSLLVLLSFSRVFESFGNLPAYIKTQGFTAEGGFLPTAIFLTTLTPLTFSKIIKKRDVAQKAFMGISLAIMALALGISVINILPGGHYTPNLPGFGVSWNIAIDAIKQYPIFGMGPGNYLTAFGRFRPVFFNTTDLWSMKFATAQDFFLTMLTETGLLGLIGLILFGAKIYNLEIKNNKKPRFVQISLGVLIIALLAFPATLTLIVTLFLLLSLNTKANKTTLNLMSVGQSESGKSDSSTLPALIVTLPIIIGILFLFYHAGRAVAAEYTFNQAINATTQNKAADAYELFQKAINTNPRVDRYHISYAQVNLALANALVQNLEGEISEDQRNTLAQLVQQAIREGQNAVVLNRTRASSWRLLGSIYQSIAPLAQGSLDFAVQSYTQAVALDPLDVNTRVTLGGIYYSAGAYENAIDTLKLAVLAKPDHANARYNLAFAYRDNGDIEQAVAQMTQVLALVNRDSKDYELAKAELEKLESQKAQNETEGTEANSGDELTAPPTGEEPALEPQLELPEEASPPAAPDLGDEEEEETNASPTPSGSPVASPSSTPLP